MITDRHSLVANAHAYQRGGLVGVPIKPLTISGRFAVELAEMFKAIDDMARKNKRPPLAWDSRNTKPLPFRWALYVNGELVSGTVIAYDVEDGSYIWSNGLAKHAVAGVSLLVKRLD